MLIFMASELKIRKNGWNRGRTIRFTMLWTLSPQTRITTSGKALSCRTKGKCIPRVLSPICPFIMWCFSNTKYRSRLYCRLPLVMLVVLSATASSIIPSPLTSVAAAVWGWWGINKSRAKSTSKQVDFARNNTTFQKYTTLFQDGKDMDKPFFWSAFFGDIAFFRHGGNLFLHSRGVDG